MSDKKLFSAWFRDQMTRTDAVGLAAHKWFQQHGIDRRGRVNAARLQNQGGIEAGTAKAVIAEYASA